MTALISPPAAPFVAVLVDAEGHEVPLTLLRGLDVLELAGVAFVDDTGRPLTTWHAYIPAEYAGLGFCGNHVEKRATGDVAGHHIVWPEIDTADDGTLYMLPPRAIPHTSN